MSGDRLPTQLGGVGSGGQLARAAVVGCGGAGELHGAVHGNLEMREGKNTCLDHYQRTLREQTEQMIKPVDFQSHFARKEIVVYQYG